MEAETSKPNAFLTSLENEMKLMSGWATIIEKWEHFKEKDKRTSIIYPLFKHLDLFFSETKGTGGYS